jgi:hypothetical protein
VLDVARKKGKTWTDWLEINGPRTPRCKVTGIDKEEKISTHS